MTKKFKIAVIPGDGVGKEVVAEGIRVLDYMAETSNGKFEVEYEHFPWGCEYYLEHGKRMDEGGVEKMRDFDAIDFGAVGFAGGADHVSLWGLRRAIGEGLDLWGHIRRVGVGRGW